MMLLGPVMRVGVVPHWHVGSCWSESPFSAAIVAHRWAIGIVVHTWGLRLLLLTHHVCIHFGRQR